MKVIDNAKREAFKHVIKGINTASDENIARLLKGLEIVSPKEYKDMIKYLHTSVKNNDPFFRFVRRILDKKQVCQNCRDKVLLNLVAQGFFINEDKKRRIRAKGGTIPATILISPTMRCNLKCIGCYAARYSMKDDMDYKTLDRVVTEAEDMGVAFFTILGGEPLVYKDLFKLFKKHKNSFFQFYTNGTLLSEKVVKELADLGSAIPMISIEGWEKQTDERRGKGTYAKVLKAMDTLKKHKVPFGISVAVTSKNAEIISSDKFIKFVVDKGAFFAWWFLYMPIGREPDLSLMPTAKQRKELFVRGKDIREKNPLFLVDFWNDAPKVGGCIAGKQYIHITSKGDVEPCIFTHFAADNIHKKSLLEIMDSEYFKALRSMQPYNDNHFMPCMWIDNPQVARDVHKKYGVYPTHPDAEFIIASEKTKKHLDKYSKDVEKEFTDLWKEHCKNCSKKCE